MMTNHICFIGGGNMAGSLISGLISNQYPTNKITVTDPDQQKLDQLKRQFSINTEIDNLKAVEASDVIVLAVKPQVLKVVCDNIKTATLKTKPLLISIAAGIRSTDIDRWLGGNNALVRCMPNTPALIQAGATGLFANTSTSDNQKNIADQILSSAGITLWVDNEAQLDAVTAVSGSGPAYFFLFLEAMQAAGKQLGLDESTAAKLAKQTALGAARMALEGDDDPTTLREKVTSKGGTTAAALASFENNNFNDIINQALTAARDRAIELADELGKD
ncbi:MAG: pyrroline-5-carboxylate reductase [endosymbiont of Galathealinum brachiosum]|uniref:Pyrroline-5-carboxylate reductase n=1 Tax=endosymbiont of Galathealinum brachiosum TaxID=2200906 RepID=A0A370DDF1_9GAMM|nr:MAG: pyrroline-5-carboxylate reductase [endosymbiont of Galathealinum brachiosum]